MALTPKTAVLQVRIDPDLLARFQTACAARDTSASQVLRQFMHAEVDAYERHLLKKRLQAEAATQFGKK
jgi:antitoxin component of RelBE/YafQ-DinJ toxin-antitoxin module